MTILDHLLVELASAKGPISTTVLASRLDVSEQALDGMIGSLVAKGKLKDDGRSGVDDIVACSGIACGTSCVGLSACPFIVETPNSYRLVISAPSPRL